MSEKDGISNLNIGHWMFSQLENLNFAMFIKPKTVIKHFSLLLYFKFVSPGSFSLSNNFHFFTPSLTFLASAGELVSSGKYIFSFIIFTGIQRTRDRRENVHFD